jgi:hypothetical protein
MCSKCPRWIEESSSWSFYFFTLGFGWHLLLLVSQQIFSMQYNGKLAQEISVTYCMRDRCLYNLNSPLDGHFSYAFKCHNALLVVSSSDTVCLRLFWWGWATHAWLLVSTTSWAFICLLKWECVIVTRFICINIRRATSLLPCVNKPPPPLLQLASPTRCLISQFAPSDAPFVHYV